MISIKKYDSRLKLSSYQIGDVYTFYMYNPGMEDLVKIKDNDYSTYIKILTDTINANDGIIDNPYINIARSIGIVVDTHESLSSGDLDYITVILKKTTNDYVLNKYVVNSIDVFTNHII